MAIVTLTLEEFNYIKDKSQKTIYEYILKYLNNKRYGLSNSVCDIDIKELQLYALVLDSWEQDKYNNQQYTNYTNSTSIRYIFNKLNKLI